MIRILKKLVPKIITFSSLSLNSLISPKTVDESPTWPMIASDGLETVIVGFRASSSQSRIKIGFLYVPFQKSYVILRFDVKSHFSISLNFQINIPPTKIQLDEQKIGFKRDVVAHDFEHFLLSETKFIQIMRLK